MAYLVLSIFLIALLEPHGALGKVRNIECDRLLGDFGQGLAWDEVEDWEVKELPNRYQLLASIGEYRTDTDIMPITLGYDYPVVTNRRNIQLIHMFLVDKQLPNNGKILKLAFFENSEDFRKGNKFYVNIPFFPNLTGDKSVEDKEFNELMETLALLQHRHNTVIAKDWLKPKYFRVMKFFSDLKPESKDLISNCHYIPSDLIEKIAAKIFVPPKNEPTGETLRPRRIPKTTNAF